MKIDYNKAKISNSKFISIAFIPVDPIEIVFTNKSNKIKLLVNILFISFYPPPLVIK